ncbi:MAG: type II toxin-antitoxin system RelE/ParE family toxin [Acidobacteria bacterium]|nr:type II toxin-antitoxin system RelE/ParE family toxin [Acidobacteriota bacterium]
MKTGFKSSFAKDLKAIKNKTVLEAVAKLIGVVEAAQNLRAIPDVKKLKAKGDYYRIKLGDYRVGITLNRDEITFVRCLDRKEIYRYFP